MKVCQSADLSKIVEKNERFKWGRTESCLSIVSAQFEGTHFFVKAPEFIGPTHQSIEWR